MRKTGRLGRYLTGAAILWTASMVAPLQAQGGGRIEAFAGNTFAEELADNISFGVRGAWMPSNGWGLMASYERYELNNGKGYGQSGGVDAQIDSLEASYVAYPRGKSFEIFTGLGVTDLNIDPHVAGATVDLQKTTWSAHVGLGYRALLGDNLYLRPEVRARVYKAGDETLDVTASIALGWSWNND